ncbi:MAG TPA: AsmA-like C-terminal domain-containing protein [Nitrospirales bacterium]
MSLPLILRSIDYKALLVWQLETQLNRKVEIGNARVKFFPHVRIALENVTVRDASSPRPFMSADRLFVDLRIFPLLTRKVVVKRVIMDRPVLGITRGADGKLNIADLFTSAQGSMTVPMLGQEITIVEGRMTFTEEFQTDVIRTLRIEHFNTTIKSGAREISAKLSAAIPHDKGESLLTLNAKAPREVTREGTLAERGEGRLEARGLNLGQLAPFLETRSLIVGGHGVVDLTTAFIYQAGKEEDSLTLKDLWVNASGTILSGSAVLNGILSKPAGFSASLTTTSFRLESLLSSLPENLLRDHGLGFLKTSDVGGPIKVVSLRISGNAATQQPVSIQGEVDLLGAHAVIGSDRVPLSDVRGLLRLETDRITIERATGKYGEAVVTAGRGEITHLSEGPELYLAVKGALAAQELAAIVARVAPKAVLPKGSGGLIGLAGEASATVLLAGPLADLENLRVEWDLEARDVGFTDPRLGFPVSGVFGRVHSIAHGLAFEQVTGVVGKATLSLNGDIRYPPKEKVVYNFIASGRGDAKDLWVMLGGTVPETATLQGATAYKVDLSGPADQLRASGSLDLTQVGLAAAAGWGKLDGVPTNLEFSLLLNPGHRLKFERVVLDIPPVHISGRGQVSLEEDRRFSTHLRVAPVGFRALPKGLVASTVTLTDGSLQADIKLDGQMDNWRTANIQGRVSIKNAAFTMERFEHSIEDLHLDVVFQDSRIDVERASVKIEDSRISGKGTIRGWRGTPVVEVVLESPGMDLDLLIPKGARSPIRTALEAITAGTKLSGTASIRNGVYKGIDFEEIGAKLSGGNNKLIVDSIDGTLPVGLVTGQLTMGLLPDKPIALESSLILDKVAVVPFLQAFGTKNPPVTGALSMKANLRGETGTYNSLNGEANIIIAKGYFQRMSATSKIIGILNLPTLLAGKVDFSNKGMPFDCLSANVVVKNGIAKVTQYVVDSPIMKMTAAGEYDIPNNSTSMVVAVSPLGSYEESLKSLPVFGKLFIGDRQDLVTAFYEVKGPLEDPKVRLLPGRSVAYGVGALGEMAFDIMKNVFLLPKELIAPSKKPASPCATF